jgi:hypothetical protein
LEEPELSLHAAIVRRLPQMLQKLRRPGGRQVILSTHSHELLSDEGIGADEVVVLSPAPNGTSVSLAGEDAQVRTLLESGLSMSDVVLPSTAPPNPNQLLLFEL